PRPRRHDAGLLVSVDRLTLVGAVLLSVGPVVHPRVLAARFAGDGRQRGLAVEAHVRLPRVLLAARAKPRAFDAVAEEVMHYAEDVIGEEPTLAYELIRRAQQRIGTLRLGQRAEALIGREEPQMTALKVFQHLLRTFGIRVR